MSGRVADSLEDSDELETRVRKVDSLVSIRVGLKREDRKGDS